FAGSAVVVPSAGGLLQLGNLGTHLILGTAQEVGARLPSLAPERCSQVGRASPLCRGRRRRGWQRTAATDGHASSRAWVRIFGVSGSNDLMPSRGVRCMTLPQVRRW